MVLKFQQLKFQYGMMGPMGTMDPSMMNMTMMGPPPEREVITLKSCVLYPPPQSLYILKFIIKCFTIGPHNSDYEMPYLLWISAGFFVLMAEYITVLIKTQKPPQIPQQNQTRNPTMELNPTNGNLLIMKYLKLLLFYEANN